LEEVIVENFAQRLYVEELRDIYDAESQLVQGPSRYGEGGGVGGAAIRVRDHLEQTREHVRRLGQVFADLGERPKAKKCKGMQGLMRGQGVIDGDFEEM